MNTVELENVETNYKPFKLLWSFLYSTLIPFCISTLIINLTITFVYIVIHRNSDLIAILSTENWATTCFYAWKSVRWNQWQYPCWAFCLLIWSVASLTLLPSQHIAGPYAISGYQPHYKLNGVKFYILSMAYWVPIILYFPMSNVYLSLVTITGYSTLGSLIVSIILLLKGYFRPSPGVFGSSNNVLVDFLHGIELYPRLGFNNTVDVKIIFISRFGFFLWQLILLIVGKASYEFYLTSYQSGQVNCSLWVVIALQTIYIAKHYIWEKHFIETVDIAQNKFGFIQCYKAMVWIPIVSSLGAIYLVKHGPTMKNFGFNHACVILVSGIISICLLCLADLQKTVVRSTNGTSNLKLTGSIKVLQVKYLDEDLQPQETVLLISGLWSFVRHPNYTFELTTALLWSIPACTVNPISYFYPSLLFIYLVHRMNWIHDKCTFKYGKQWEEYCRLVPYRLIPYFY
ncbi:7-dehydrocholesterol reductase-like [Tetranychus urticae]|uniref:7-dehydrocholesterol reductase-like n=1 Tax=Tetranychus urticae TaxID=32264 RepID=UPI00077BF637|nr:7-dehydrocholesterol reductase-like [Tetranychus urticae]